MVREVASKSSPVTGAGTTTTPILTHAISNRGCTANTSSFSMINHEILSGLKKEKNNDRRLYFQKTHDIMHQRGGLPRKLCNREPRVVYAMKSYAARRIADKFSLGVTGCAERLGGPLAVLRRPHLRGDSDLNPGAIMALPARFSLLHSNLNDFLFASVGEEQNGVTLSVLSALTRLGLDPWEEAEQLVPLPKSLAAEALAKLIARLPIRRTQSLDDLAISRRLVQLLPDQKPAPLQGRQRASGAPKKYMQAMILLACLALGAAVLFSVL